MTNTEKTNEIHNRDFDAVIFDTDGVVTKTATVHATAWKRMFDAYLEEHGKKTGVSFVPFDADVEYKEYVDGKPRYDGVDSFMRSRGIVLERGTPSDSPEMETVCGLGNRKNAHFIKVVEEQGVEAFESTLELIRDLHKAGIRTALISASKNCRAIVGATDSLDLFETIVDGLEAEKTGFPGKPAPDVFLVAAKRLNVTPERAVIVEDAISGVQAGAAGHFGMVLGVAREGNKEALKENGADVVVTDLAEMRVVDDK
ncbi:MAG: beta-phosphoglucomutase family hydrolase [Pseudomonadota bacterium]|nr:beta-phosphoglucomutase family hydrolase [Pseudomonadota bacterium]